MSGLKQLRNRVKSIKSTQKITKAMQLVSAAKLKKIKDLASDMEYYSSELKVIMQKVSQDGNNLDISAENMMFFTETSEKLPHLLVVMTSDRGLCGNFNSSIIKKLEQDINQMRSEGRNLKLLIIGQKGFRALSLRYNEMIEEFYDDFKDSEDLAILIKNKILSLVKNGDFGSCSIYYNKFKNAITQIPTREDVLPIKVDYNKQHNNSSYHQKYDYEGENFIEKSVDLYIAGILNYALMQSKISQEGARMSAMDNATRNAGELIDELTLKLNRSRQAIITTELTEIISGAEAL